MAIVNESFSDEDDVLAVDGGVLEVVYGGD